jgi:orotidine-5'-phosphate decarboxylase
VAEHVAGLVNEWGAELLGTSGYSSVGAVVGATRPEHIARMRELMPHAWFLIPGVGAQGGQASDTAAAFDKDGLGAVVNSSRGILYAYDDPADPAWADAVRGAAARLADELRAAALQTTS